MEVSGKLSPNATTSNRNKFSVYDLVEEAPPRSFHEAAERGNTKFLIRTIERNIEFDINQKDRHGRTALHWAAEMGQISAAEALLDYKIDLKATESTGRTAIHLAARSGDVDMLKVLFDQVKSVPEQEELANQPDNFNCTPVFLARQCGDEGIKAFEYLLSKGGRFNEQIAMAGETLTQK